MDTEQACGLVDKAIDALGRVEVADLDGEGMRAVTDRLRGARTHVAHLDTALATRAADLAPTGTCEDPVDLLSGAGAMPAGRARRVARNAELLGRMPELAAAFTAVAVTEDHVDAVATARRRVDASVRHTSGSGSSAGAPTSTTSCPCVTATTTSSTTPAGTCTSTHATAP